MAYKSKDESPHFQHWKYIERWREKGEWKYRYPSEKSNKQSKNEKKKTGFNLLNFFSNLGSKVAETGSKIVESGRKFVSSITNKKESVITNPDKKKYKYIAKVPLGNGEYRYFYDQKEYENYLKGKSFVNKILGVGDKIKDTVQDVGDKAVDFVNDLLDKYATTEVTTESLSGQKPVATIKNDDGTVTYFFDREEYNSYVRGQNFVNNLRMRFNGKDDLANLPTKTTEMSQSEDMAEINNNYDPSNPNTSQNCAFCSIAYDLRRRGYDVEALEQPSALTSTDIFGLYGERVILKQFGDKEYNFSDRETREANKQDFEDTLLDYGDGARGILNIEWTNGGGHAVNWEIMDGELYIIDAQNNTSYRFDEYESMGAAKKVQYIRTDNVEPSEGVLNYVTPKERGDE